MRKPPSGGANSAIGTDVNHVMIGRRRAFVALRVLDGQLVQQRLSPGIVLGHRHETKLLRRGGLAGWGITYISNVSSSAAFRRG